MLWPDDAAVFRAWHRQAEILRKSGELRRALAAYQKARAHPACVDRWFEVIERGLAETSAAAPKITLPTTDDEPIVETSSGAVLRRDGPDRPAAPNPSAPKPPARPS